VTTDKTGAETTVTRGHDKFNIAVEGEPAGLSVFTDRGNQRVFLHTEVSPEFGGRGLATILVEEALNATRAEGMRIVAVCEMVEGFLGKHKEFDDIVDPLTDELEDWLEARRPARP
jgi:predicted GNAT family acetyltransferase